MSHFGRAPTWIAALNHNKNRVVSVLSLCVSFNFLLLFAKEHIIQWRFRFYQMAVFFVHSKEESNNWAPEISRFICASFCYFPLLISFQIEIEIHISNARDKARALAVLFFRCFSAFPKLKSSLNNPIFWRYDGISRNYRFTHSEINTNSINLTNCIQRDSSWFHQINKKKEADLNKYLFAH